MARRSPGRATPVALTALLLAVLPPPARAGKSTQIWSDNFEAVFAVETRGVLYNGTVETEKGSGFFISEDGLALTANHVVLNERENYQTLDIKVTTVDANSVQKQLSAQIVDVDHVNDIALLLVDGVQNQRRVTIGQPASAKIGEDVSAIGYALGMEEAIVSGIIGSKPRRNSWRTTAPVNPGDSGGPVFEETQGTAIGLVTAGVSKVTYADGSVYYPQGIKYFVPLDLYRLPARSTNKFSSRIDILGHGIDVTKSPTVVRSRAARSPAETLTRGYEVSFEKTDHPVVLEPHSRVFEARFAAESGYKITKVVGVVPRSANHASTPLVSIADDGRSLTVRSTLTSGPMIDQYRAWLDATIMTAQQRTEVAQSAK